MPGTASDSRLLQFVGAVFFIVAVVGTVLLDWEFGGSPAPVPLALGLLAVVVAVGATLFARR
jgi:hypothetical protein